MTDNERSIPKRRGRRGYCPQSAPNLAYCLTHDRVIPYRQGMETDTCDGVKRYAYRNTCSIAGPFTDQRELDRWKLKLEVMRIERELETGDIPGANGPELERYGFGHSNDIRYKR